MNVKLPVGLFRVSKLTANQEIQVSFDCHSCKTANHMQQLIIMSADDGIVFVCFCKKCYKPNKIPVLISEQNK